MDIPVSRLNKRMALQLPAEFPLGLVFVVGKVRDISNTKGESVPSSFHIVENGYKLRCKITKRAVGALTLKDDDIIRASGHLAFDTQQANYFLLARDIEILAEPRPNRTTVPPILADIKKRSQAANLVPAELPQWVQQIAPPEIQEAAKQAGQNGGTKETAESETVVEVQPTPDPVEIEEEPLPDGFTDELVEFLSEAMDSQEEVELTPEMVAGLAPAIKPEEVQASMDQPSMVQPHVEPDVKQVKSDEKDVDPDVQEERLVPWQVVFGILLVLVVVLGVIFALIIIAAI